MAEYIERDIFINNELIPLVKQLDLCHPKQKKGVLMAIQKLNEAPSADVVEVVRCKDCEHCCISTDPKTNISIQKCGYVGFNPVQSSQVSDDFYCGYGELKEREGK